MSSIASGTGCQVAHLYRVENLVTGSYYIGKHNGLTQNRYWGSGTVWKHHVKKHGTKDLRYTILAIGTPSYILDLERAYITHAYIQSHPLCYNLAQGGYGPMRLSEESVRKIAQSLRGKPSWNKGIPMSEASKVKLSASLKGNIPGNKGIPMSDESRAKVSASKRMNPFKHDPVVQDRISRNLVVVGARTRFTRGIAPWNKGIPLAPEHVEKMRAMRLGSKASAETKAKMSLAQRGKKLSLEARTHMSVAQKNVPKLTCPHCLRVGGYRPMQRWHFDHCRMNKGGQRVVNF